MLDLAGKTLIERVYETVKRSQQIDKIVVATSIKESDDILVDKLENLQIEYYRGDLENVLKRFFDVAKKYEAQNIIRITADNPLMDAKLIDELILHYKSKKVNYSMFLNGVYGLSAEVFDFNSLKEAYEKAKNDYDKEHVTPYIKRNFKIDTKDIKQKYSFPNLRATIDTIEDYIQMQKFMDLIP
jgi:spore coat polysaccharide biosynthesis protein SpsF